MSDFTAGFTARHNAAAKALHRAFCIDGETFAPADIKQRAGIRSPTYGESTNPRHFSPADPDADPTEGWDPFDPASSDSRPAGASGFVDPVKAAHEMGYAEGKVAGLAEAAAGDMRDRALLESLATALRGGGQLDRDRMAAQLRQTVLHLVHRIVGEVGVSADLLAQRIAVASEMLADSAESALLHVHPNDFAILEGKLPGTVFAAGDPAVARGSFVLESASTIVEDGPELWIEQLTQAIDRVAVPQG